MRLFIFSLALVAVAMYLDYHLNFTVLACDFCP